MPIQPLNPNDLLTSYQVTVLDYLESKKGQYLTVSQIHLDTSVLFNTVKKCLSSLLEYRRIKITDRIKIGKNKFMLIETIKDRGLVMSEEHIDDNEEYDPEKDYSVDKSVYEKWTDEEYTDFSLKKATSMLSKHPELKYWDEKGLSIKQIGKWCKEFDIDSPNMSRNLKFCAFDLRVNKNECDSNGEPIKSAINYFYSSLKKNQGFYPKPENYKSHRQILEERNQEYIAERQEEIRRLKESRIRKENVDHELAFERMIADPDCDIYKRCFDRLPETMKNRPKGIMFTRSMRSSYASIHGLEGFCDPQIQDSYLEKLRKSNPDTDKK